MTPHPHMLRKVQMGSTQETEDEMVLDEANRVLRPRKRVRQDGPAEEVLEPPAKKSKSQKPPLARPRARTGRRTRPDENTGKLSLLIDMPLDILFVICSFLSPKTLFSLLDVSNAFRELLTASNAATIWIGLRKSYNAPEPASFIDGSGEFVWAQVLFDESGKECGELERAKVRQRAFHAWRQKYHDQLQQDRREEERFLCKQRLRDIKQRILDLGYPEEDLVDVEKCQSFDIPVRLTSASWEGIKAEVLTIVHQTRKHRLMNCSTGVLGAPSPRSIGASSPAPRLSFYSKKLTITSNDFAVLFRDDWRAFLKKVREWSVSRKERFIFEWGCHLKDDSMNTLVQDIGLLHSSEEHYTWKMPWQLPSMDFGNLAIAQLRCFQCDRICTTLNAAGRHQGNVRECRLTRTLCNASGWVFRFSPSKAALQVIGLSGLSPTTASADDMDAKGDFFKCLACHEEFVGTWRECITYHDIHHIPEFQLLEDHDAVHEDKRKSWACSLCNTHLVAQETRPTVIKHLESDHGTTEPKVPKDYFYAGAY
ncbi:hypothetical protein WG66_013448 [Moniliophthora roreri]|nr:hypothetical protein WG66_013448 [Moniliophthora roreri]